MDEKTLFTAYRRVRSPDRWVIRELPVAGSDRYYVQDTHLGYCTDPVSFENAVREARQRNRDDDDERLARQQ